MGNLNTQEIISKVESSFLKKDLPFLQIGDNVKVGVKIIEGNKERVQQFRGVVIQRRGKGHTETFTVRKMSGNIGVERIFPSASPSIEKVDINKYGRVRRARIFYFRELICEATRQMGEFSFKYYLNSTNLPASILMWLISSVMISSTFDRPACSGTSSFMPR